MNIIDNVLTTMRAQEKVVEGIIQKPLAGRFAVPQGPAGTALSLRQGRSILPIHPLSFGPKALPLRPSVTAQTPADVKVVTI